MSQLSVATIGSLTIYPVKSCAGISLLQARIGSTGLEHDRRWMLVRPDGYFATQRELPKMALIQPQIQEQGIVLNAPGMPALSVSGMNTSRSIDVGIWRDFCLAYDEGHEAAEWFSTYLLQPLRLVRFNDERVRLSSHDWTGALQAPNHFSDGYPILIISTASLADLNTRLVHPLPMNRFRPNIVLDSVEAYAEDRIDEMRIDEICLRLVKPCTRCKITTTNQETAVVEGDEPLLALTKYRRDLKLKGVSFGQNAVIVSGQGCSLHVGDQLEFTFKRWHITRFNAEPG